MSWFINDGWFFKNIAILSAKGITFRCLLMGISKNEGLKRLNNSVIYVEKYGKYLWSMVRILAQIKHQSK